MADRKSSKRARRSRTGRHRTGNRRVHRKATPPPVETSEETAEHPRVVAPARGRIWSAFERLARGRSSRRRRRPRSVLRLFAFVLVAAGLGYLGYLAHQFVVRSPHFQVKRVDVSPTVRVTAQDVRRLAGIGARTNIFGVDLDRLCARVKRHPWIASCKAHRRLPHTIRLEVLEEEAVAAVLVRSASPGALGRFYLVNEEGRAFKVAMTAELDGLPLITGINRRDYTRDPKAAARQIRRGVQAFRRYARHPRRPALGEVHLDEVEGITLYTAKGNLQIRLGRGGLPAKLRRLDRVLGALRQRARRPAVIRLDNKKHPERVTVRVAEAN